MFTWKCTILETHWLWLRFLHNDLAFSKSKAPSNWLCCQLKWCHNCSLYVNIQSWSLITSFNVFAMEGWNYSNRYRYKGEGQYLTSTNFSIPKVYKILMFPLPSGCQSKSCTLYQYRFYTCNSSFCILHSYHIITLTFDFMSYMYITNYYYYHSRCL